jgi:hypothetical protein
MTTATHAWSEVRTSRAVVPAHVVHRAFAQETVLLNVRTGQYHGIDCIGARFLEVATAEGQDLGRASEALAGEFGQPIDRIQGDLAAFLDALAERGLVELAPPAA